VWKERLGRGEHGALRRRDARCPLYNCRKPTLCTALAEQVAASDKDYVADSAASTGAWYRWERFVPLVLAAVDSMVTNGPEIDENDARLVAVREQLCDRLKALLEWARSTGRWASQDIGWIRNT
jgi:hypothetical protein